MTDYPFHFSGSATISQVGRNWRFYHKRKRNLIRLYTAVSGQGDTSSLGRAAGSRNGLRYVRSRGKAGESAIANRRVPTASSFRGARASGRAGTRKALIVRLAVEEGHGAGAPPARICEHGRQTRPPNYSSDASATSLRSRTKRIATHRVCRDTRLRTPPPSESSMWDCSRAHCTPG